MDRMIGSFLASLALIFTGSGDARAQATTCNPSMTTNECAEAQLKAAAAILGQYKAEVARLETEISALKNTPKPQVGMIPCYKKFSTVGATNPLVVDFDLKMDCQDAMPKDGWTYTATLLGTTICGGYGEYIISADPKKPSIKFFFGVGPFCPSTGSEVWLHYIGFSPRAF
ncbi:hypothetical protein IVB56_27175 [Bradyrhizobium sp. CW7]|uniref:hypothetical protein n=1 Tax=Bradyrhizobium sp. CW7 TaxID=2782688 RepID=UPI001FFB232D|nr:hypothetical protein [Bradyrhizobium sp. CW7]MCK1354632.1 hypothetical protein [Bradyrhizobium sp. CW7]